MKLYDWMATQDHDYFDCYDVDPAVSVSVSKIEKVNSNYDKFMVELMKKVDFVSFDDLTGDVTCDWSKLISDNLDKFKNFTDIHWRRNYDDLFEFTEQWVQELGRYAEGWLGKDFYAKLVDFVESLDPGEKEKVLSGSEIDQSTNITAKGKEDNFTVEQSM